MPILLTLIVLTLIGALILRRWKQKTQRQELLEAPLSDHQKALILTQVPLIKRLPPDLHAKLEGKISLFLHQVDMIGCNGLEVTQEMRLSIASQACLLVVNSEAWYRNLRTILIYPSAFKSKTTHHDGFVVHETETVRLGESWARGPVILSWKHTKLGAADESDGHNLVLHEFAHQLDDLSGETNGVPVLGPHQNFADWERVFLTAFETHRQKVMAGRQTVLNAYGAENHQEFFAVAIEVFFEQPQRLKKEEPEVYDHLSDLLLLDPSSWS